jgi:propionyl-CoA carboxylase alpha chain
VRTIRRLLVANRAEIASRVIRSARARGIETVAIFSDADAELPYVTEADVAVNLPGAAPSETYLRIDRVVDAAVRTRCDAVHPGYGFLSENAEFATACERAGLIFVGPPPAVIASMGSKIEAKRLMAAAGVPVLEGAEVTERCEAAELSALGARVGYPLLVKASFGGGGRGMRVVERDSELADEVAAASREATSAFGNGTVFLERLVVAPRHVEVQVLGDAHGTVTHLFERECSIQRRHQKLLEETPSPGISDATRAAMFDSAVTAARAIGYVNAGTVEFVVDSDERFYFLEVNTRLQVEHPVTELVSGLDLVDLQLQIAQGAPLGESVLGATAAGHAIEVRLYAEDPDDDYLPASGRLSTFEFDSAPGIRLDAGYASGSVVSTNYDAMLAKLVAWAPTRAEAATILASALRRARIHGVTTNRDLLVGMLEATEFLEGVTDTAFLDRHPPRELCRAARSDDEALACVAAALWQRLFDRANSNQPAGIPAAWRNVGPADQPRTYRLRGDRHVVLISGGHGARRVTLDGRDVAFGHVEVSPDGVRGEFDGRTIAAGVVRIDRTVYVDGSLGSLALLDEPRLQVAAVEEAPGSLHAPLPGSVRVVAVSAGEEVRQGDILVILEAMKMEHSIRAPHRGVVESVLVKDGDQVDSGAVLVVVAPLPGEDP